CSIAQPPCAQPFNPLGQERLLKRTGLGIGGQLEIRLDVQEASSDACGLIKPLQRGEAGNESPMSKPDRTVAPQRVVTPGDGILVCAVDVVGLRQDALMPEDPGVERRKPKALFCVLDRER